MKSPLSSWPNANKEVAALPSEASQIVEECGNLPLALALCGAQVNDGIPWKDLLEALQEVALKFLDHPQGSVMKSIKIGIDRLPIEQKECYLELAVFPPDEPIPEAGILTLWTHANKLKERDARQILSVLGRKALLRIENSKTIGSSTVELHDLQHDYLQGICKDVKSLHMLLLDAYRQKTSNGWHTGPNDGYYFQHLAYHLIKAGLAKDLKLLLFDLNWIRAKLSAFDIAILVNDYDCARPQEDPDIYSVRKAIRFSANALDKDRSQLPSQLFGHLTGSESQWISTLLKQAKETTSYPWLRPLTPCLISSSRGISSVVVTPNNRRILSGSSYRTIEVWDLETGEGIGTLRGHTKGISSVTVSSDGQKAVSGSSDHTIKVWDLENLKEIKTLEGHTDTVFSVAVSLDGQKAISGSNDRTIKVWDLETCKEIRTLKGHTDSIYSVAIFPDCRRVVSGSDDSTIKVWDLETCKEIRTLKGHTDWISAVAVSPDSRRIISGSWDKTTKVWDSVSGKEILTLKGHKREVSAVAISPDGRRVVTGSWDHTAKVWDLVTGKEILTFKGHNRPVGAVAFSSDGRKVVTGSWDHTSKVWDLVTGKEILTLKGNIITIGVSAIALSHDGRWAVSGSSDGIITIEDFD